MASYLDMNTSLIGHEINHAVEISATFFCFYSKHFRVESTVMFQLLTCPRSACPLISYCNPNPFVKNLLAPSSLMITSLRSSPFIYISLLINWLSVIVIDRNISASSLSKFFSSIPTSEYFSVWFLLLYFLPLVQYIPYSVLFYTNPSILWYLFYPFNLFFPRVFALQEIFLLNDQFPF